MHRKPVRVRSRLDSPRRTLARGAREARRIGASWGNSAGIVLVAALLSFTVACSEDASPSPQEDSPVQATRDSAEPSGPTRPLAAPVLVVAADGVDWDIALPLLRAGEMPHLERLMQAGSYGELSTFQAARSPVIWTSAATGKGQGLHGIGGFTRDDGSGGRRLYTSEDRRTKAFWNILSDYGVENDTIGWWVTFPVEEVNGLMVAQTNTTAPEHQVRKGSVTAGLSNQIHPPAREPEIMRIVAEAEQSLDERVLEIFGEQVVELSNEQQARWDACRWSFRADSIYLAIALARAARGPAQVTSIYFGGTDVVGHRFYAARDPERFGLDPEGQEARAFGEVIDNYYRFFDTALGQLLEAWPENTSVFLLADHGMAANLPKDGETFDPGASGAHSLGERGVFVASGQDLRAARPGVSPRTLQPEDMQALGSVMDLCPILLSFLGIPVGADMHGRAIDSILELEAFEQWPLEVIPTHDHPSWLAGRRATGAEIHDVEERLEQLRKLGYLDEEGADK